MACKSEGLVMHTSRVDISQMPLHKGLEHGVTGELGVFHSKEYKSFKEEMLNLHGVVNDRPIKVESLCLSGQILLLIGLGWVCPELPIDENLFKDKNKTPEFLFLPINEKTDEAVLLKSAIYLSMPGAAETVASKWHPSPFLLELYKVTICVAFLTKKSGISFEVLVTRVADYALETISGNYDMLQFIYNKVASSSVINVHEFEILKQEIQLPPQSTLLQRLQ